MRRWLIGSLVVLVTALAACSAPTIDGSSDQAARESAQRVRESLPEGQRDDFDNALMAVTMHSAFGDKSLLEIAASNPEQAKANALARLDGKTAEEVIKMADAIRADRLEAERRQALAEIVELEEKQRAAEAAAAGLAKFEVTRSRYYKYRDRYIGAKPVLELTVVNNTGHAISRAYFQGVVSSPGRSVPWIDDRFNYEIPGGLEPGETAEWSLAPNMFSDWGRDTPDDTVLTVKVLRLDDAQGKPLFDVTAFSEEMQSRLVKLKESYGDP